MKSTLTYSPKFFSTNIGGYRYFFNGQEADNEVFGEVSLHAFEFRMHDARLGRFWSVDPLAAKYPWNSTYAFAENSPIGYLEMEGLERLLAVTMGEDVKYRASFIKTHNTDVESLNIKNGEIAIGILANFLVENTKKDDKGIGFIAIFSHGTPNNIFVKGDFGNGISSYDLDEIGSLVDDQSIKIFEECVIYLGGCNTGTKGDMINKEGKLEYLIFAQKLADMTNATVIAANDRVTPITEKKDGSEMSYSVSNPNKGSFFIYRKGQDPVSIGGTVNIMDYFKKIENRDSSNSNSDGQ
jgi:RHS repeat-associated protein